MSNKKLDVRLGDIVSAYGNRKTAEVSGTVTRKGRANVQIHAQIRFSPTGPWYDQVHTVPIAEITQISRDGVKIYGVGKHLDE